MCKRLICVVIAILISLTILPACSDDTETSPSDQTLLATIYISPLDKYKNIPGNTLTFSGTYSFDFASCNSFNIEAILDSTSLGTIDSYSAGSWQHHLETDDILCGEHTFKVLLSACDATSIAQEAFYIIPRANISISPSSNYAQVVSNRDTFTLTGTYTIERECCQSYAIIYSLDKQSYRRLTTISSDSWEIEVPLSSLACGTHLIDISLTSCELGSTISTYFILSPSMQLGITTPTPGEYFDTSKTKLTITGTYYVDSNCCQNYKLVEYAIDNDNFKIASTYTGNTWKDYINTSDIDYGMHYLHVRVNACGFTSTPITTTFYLTPFLDIKITTPTSGYIQEYADSLVVQGTYYVDPRWCSSSSILYNIDGGVLNPVSSFSNDQWQILIPSASLPLGTHTLTVMLNACGGTPTSSITFLTKRSLKTAILNPLPDTIYGRYEDINLSGTAKLLPSEDCAISQISYGIDDPTTPSAISYFDASTGFFTSDIPENVLLCGKHTLYVTFTACDITSSTALDFYISFLLGPEFQVNAGTTYNQELAAVDINSSNIIAVAWASAYQLSIEGSIDVFARRFDFNRNPIDTTDILLNTFTYSAQTRPDIRIKDDNSFTAIWISYSQSNANTWHLYGNHFDAYANKTFSYDVQLDPPGCASDTPQMTKDASSNLVMAWYDCGEVFYGKYTFDLSPIKSPTIANQTVEFAQNRPAIGVDYLNRFVIAWVSYNQDSSGNGVYARRFYWNANPIGDEFLVPQTVAADQDQPAVAIDNEGHILVVWRSYVSQGNWDIFARFFDFFGNPLTPETQINVNTEGNQGTPVVVADSNNLFIIVWASYHGDYSDYGISSRIVKLQDSQIMPITGEWIVNEVTSGGQRDPDIAIAPNNKGVIVWTSPDGSSNGIKARLISCYY